MFLVPMSLQNISQLRIPSEKVPLSEYGVYKEALLLVEEGAFSHFELAAETLLNLKIFWNDSTYEKPITVTIQEEKTFSNIQMSCSVCTGLCEHQWASYILLWQTLATDTQPLVHPELILLAEQLKARVQEDPQNQNDEFALTKLDSISLYFDENAVLKTDSMGTYLKTDLTKYKSYEVTKEKEMLSPRTWNLPEIFRRKMVAYSGSYLHEVNQQNRLADIVCYNFSNGLQLSAKEVLRHPLYKKIPNGLLPQAQSQVPAFAKWDLIQQIENNFVSQAVSELEKIMQTLLAKIVESHRQGQVELFLQNRQHPGRGLQIKAIEFDASAELDWRVDFADKKELISEFKLVSFRKLPFSFFESFALQADEQIMVVHPWYRELSLLQETISSVAPDLLITGQQMPVIDVIGEFETKTILKYLRTRAIAVKITGESKTLRQDDSLTEIRLNENGHYYIQHDARVPGQKNLVRKGWTSLAMLYLQALSQGLPFLLGIEAREMAARVGNKRDWDMKLLKHLGVLQYLMTEVLSLHFDKTLLDGMVVLPENLFVTLHDKIKILLLAGSAGPFIRDVPLTELCSKSVLVCFEDFVKLTFKSMGTSESFYSEAGEVILEGVTEREFRLIFELLKKMALASNGEAFRKSRTSFLSKISTHNFEEDPAALDATYHFPNATTLQDALESMQVLIPFGFKIFYKDQPLQELAEDEFRVDFTIQTETDQKFLNWFELNPKFFLRGEEVEAENFLSLGRGGVIEYAGKLYLVPKKQMPSLKRLENFWQKLQKGKTENSKRKNGEKVYQLPRSQTLELLALRSSGVPVRGDFEWQKLCDFYDTLGTKTRELVLPASTKAVLKPYQTVGVQWLQDLYNLKLGALLADDMGLGKTLQTLTFLDDLRSKNEMGQVLIVVPSSLIFNWQSEIEKFTPELPLAIFTNREQDRIGRLFANQEQMVVITTYGLLLEHEQFLNQYKWKVLIFDEAQNLKNITTKRTAAARSLTAQFKIGLTGTPMENHYGEFYSLVDILVPGSLGKIDDFRKQFVNRESITRDEVEELKLKIKPLLLRRTKKEILDQLPEKQETKISIAFEERQKEIYRDIALSYNQRVQETMAIQGEASVQLQMLTALLRLRQACSDPAALPNIRYDKVPPKLETLLDSVQEIVESGESALVFTQFLQTLEHTSLLLRKAGIPVFVLHGGVPAKQRQKILGDFNNTVGGAVLVMTLKTGGVGLNLTKASYVFHLEPWWNPSVENQATDRAHRLGQSKAVQVFKYIMHESLEEKIELLKERKDKKFQSLFSSTEKETEIGAGSAALSKKDFDILLGLD
ncbi:MAG: DEAD/DEAH box helicase [Bdellovibrionaceae bacterium]|nr:DEAD/DEAH box helicase [Bdellovibrio sp.]